MASRGRLDKLSKSRENRRSGVEGEDQDRLTSILFS